MRAAARYSTTSKTRAFRPLQLPRREAPRVEVMLLDACRAAFMGEADLDFQLIVGDGEIADRTGCPDTGATRGAIRCSRWQFPTADRYARSCSKPRLISIRIRFHYGNPG
jgi:hypothetical protein